MTNEPIVVVGSGPCGAVAAHRLVERGLDVVLLDAGPVAPRGLTVRAGGNTVFRKMDWSLFQTDRLAPRCEGLVEWHSSHSLGGLSNYWTAAVPRFSADDFADGARLDERYAWPVGYDDLEPYYRRAEQHLTVTAGPSILGVPDNELRHRLEIPADWQDVADRCAARGEGLGPLPMAKGDPWMAVARGTEFSSYHCVLKPMLEEPRFELRTGAKVERLIWSPEKSRVTAVQYIDHTTGRRVEQPARRVIVAAGTVDSTMILLRSTSSDFPTGLGNTNDVLGRYIHDHPREWWPATLKRPMRALAHPMYLARQPHDEAKPLLATSHTIGLTRPSDRLRTFVKGKSTSIGVQVFGTMVPQPDAVVGFDDDDTDRWRPTISLTYDDDTVANIVASRDRFRDVLAEGGLDVDVSGPFHDMTPGSSVHLAGSVRMHDDPQYGVVDRWNRVHDAPEVVVCDMSSFTTSPEKNPTLTAMALAIRAADRVADDGEADS